MIETDRVLRPLQEAESAIEQLDTYESPAVLTEALRATWQAVDRTLRTLLRSDASAPDNVRLTALSPEQMNADAVMLELRRRDMVSLGLAGRIHELRQALQRAERGAVRAADADNARDVVRCLIEEVHGAARRGTTPSTDPQILPRVRSPDQDDERGDAAGVGLPRWTRAEARPLLLAATSAALLVLATAAVFLFADGSELEQGVAAFGEGRMDVAEQHFRAALQQDPEDTTARLYLARILRRESRHQEAADLLREAAALHPDDAAVRRELGYLFVDLDRPAFASAQFRRAVEIDAEDPLNWIGLVRALAQSGDSAAAAEWLRRAPTAAREMVGER